MVKAQMDMTDEIMKGVYKKHHKFEEGKGLIASS